MASLKKATEDLERRMITEALEGTKNNQQQAARMLGLSRQGLINKMKRDKKPYDTDVEAKIKDAQARASKVAAAPPAEGVR